MNENEILENTETEALTNNFDKREMMRYRTNGTSYKLGLIGMICSLFGAFICLNSMNPDNVQVILIILLNVVILLGGFLAAEKVKAYSKKGAIAQMIFGGICVARIFYIPLIIMINYSRFVSSIEWNDIYERWDVIDSEKYNSAVKYLGATITSKFNGNVANSYLPASGIFRGIAAMVLFGIAGACFIAAGIIGSKRAKALESYMNSLENN